MADSAQQQLVSFLEARVFGPILSESATPYSEDEKRILDDVKQRTQRERARYRDYEDANKVRRMYLDDVEKSSEAAERVNEELSRLGLPRLEQVRDEFLALCDRLGVH